MKLCSEVRIYKRKQESKKTGKQEKNGNKNSTKKVIKKKESFFLFFLVAFLVETCFLSFFLVFLSAFLVEFFFSYFLVYFYKFKTSVLDLWRICICNKYYKLTELGIAELINCNKKKTMTWRIDKRWVSR